MTKRYVQQLENELKEGKTERVKRAKKNAKKTRKKITKKVEKISKKSVKPSESTNSTEKQPKQAIKKPLSEAQKRLIVLLSESYGTKTVSDICAELKIDRKTYYNWTKEHPEILDEVGNSFDAKLEYIEYLLLDHAQNGSETAAVYLHKSMLSHPYAHARRRFLESKIEYEKLTQLQAEQKAGITINVSSDEVKNAIDLL